MLACGGLCLDAAPPPQPRRFDTPDEAAKALVAAVSSGDRPAVDAIFGPQAAELLSGDARQDAIEFAAFGKAVRQYTHLVRKTPDLCTLDIGAQNWPMPIPLVHRDGAWFFDTTAGKEEVLNRRIGRDELTAIGVCRTFVTAEQEYDSVSRDGSGFLSYAQKLKSTKDTKDGLYWPVRSGEAPSPFGPLVAEARTEGYVHGPKTTAATPSFHGYRFKVLTSQGPAAPGGALDYIINGRMTSGFALVAYPAHWGDSGVMTFLVGLQGVVYECNLGPESATLASAMTQFNPDSEWTPVAP